MITGAASGNNMLLVKGAAECVLARCSHVMMPDGRVVPMTGATKAAVEGAIRSMATSALRCLALAQRDLAATPLAQYNGDAHHPAHAGLVDLSSYEKIESGMTFLGLVGLQDPPRPEVRQAICDCGKAGIRVIVITGAAPSVTDSVMPCPCLEHAQSVCQSASACLAA